VYDTVIENRQRKVMKSATRSSAIVSSLFPSNVRTRLYEDSAPAAVPDKEQSQLVRKTSFMANTQTSAVDPINSGPIADLFESTTVLFADIKGFTNWYVLSVAASNTLSSFVFSTDLYFTITGVHRENPRRFSFCWKLCMVPTIRWPKSGECTR
jgi:hypothetical protein